MSKIAIVEPLSVFPPAPHFVFASTTKTPLYSEQITQNLQFEYTCTEVFVLQFVGIVYLSLSAFLFASVFVWVSVINPTKNKQKQPQTHKQKQTHKHTETYSQMHIIEIFLCFGLFLFFSFVCFVCFCLGVCYQPNHKHIKQTFERNKH